MFKRALACYLSFLTLFAADYDCILIGSSPFSLFEALYQAQFHKRVLVLEGADRFGGAWHSIELFGIPNIDAACHFIGADPNTHRFLEIYGGCKLIPHGDHFYFSRGSHELVENLVNRLKEKGVELRLNCYVREALYDRVVKLQTSQGDFTSDKLIVTPMTSLVISQALRPLPGPKMKHRHLFLLIADPTPSRFAYLKGGIEKALRIMNLTPFHDLQNQKLIAIQTDETNAKLAFDQLKEASLIDKEASLLDSALYTYYTGKLHQGQIFEIGAPTAIEILPTGSFNNLSRYIPRWEKALDPYKNFQYN